MGRVSSAAEIGTGTSGFGPTLPANLASTVPSAGEELGSKVRDQMALRAFIAVDESQSLHRTGNKYLHPLELHFLSRDGAVVLCGRCQS